MTSKRHLINVMSKATLYLKDPIHKALRLKAAETQQSMSDLVNDAIEAALLEDIEDIDAWRESKNEEKMGFEEFVKLLKKDGVI
jgi:plasmid stability protein